MELLAAPQRRSNLIPFFTLIIVPGGNIQRTVGEIKKLTVKQWHGHNAAWLPDVIYLGFFHGTAGFKPPVGKFRNFCGRIFAAMPAQFECSHAEIQEDCCYIVPKEPIDAMCRAADEAAESMGLSRANMMPFHPGLGFFMGKDVTLPPFKTFSFRHLDLALMKIDTEGTEWLSATWTMLAKAPRHIGPRPRILEE